MHLDCKFPIFVYTKELKEKDEKVYWLYEFLLTCGIILCNKNAYLSQRTFHSFSRSMSNFVSKQILKKRELIHRFYKKEKVRSLVNVYYIIRGTYLAKKCIINVILQ